jgi:hypothetical protein
MGITSITFFQVMLFATPKRRNRLNSLFFEKKYCIWGLGMVSHLANHHGDGTPWLSGRRSLVNPSSGKCSDPLYKGPQKDTDRFWHCLCPWQIVSL